MASFAHGSVRWLAADAATTTYTVSGLSFQPKAIRFYWTGIGTDVDSVGQTTNERRGIGFASSTSSRRCVGTFSLDNAAAADTDAVACNDCVAVTTTGAGAIDGKLDLNSITSDGFTLIVDDQLPTLVNITIFWEAWGGDDISTVTIGDIAEPAATGTVSYTATGFVTSPAQGDQVVMFAGVQSTAAVNTAAVADSGLAIGFTTGTSSSNNIVLVGNSDEGSATLDTDGYNYTGDCLAMITVAGGNPNARATLSAWATDQFTLNWSARATTSRRYIYMAIKGGLWTAGATTINANTGSATTTVSGLPYVPTGMSLMGAGKAISTAGTATADDMIALGSGSSTSSRRSQAVYDENGTANTELNHIIEFDQVLAYPTNAGAIDTAIDINAMNNDGWQLIVDTAGGVASEWIGYLTFGTAPALTQGNAAFYEDGTESGSTLVSGTTYYFDASDAAASDPGAVWTSDSNAFDGSTTTSASTATQGSTSSNYLLAEGTDAPTSGDPISNVYVRIYQDSGLSVPVAAAVYTNGLGELLGTATAAVSAAYGSYQLLNQPSGGWTWTKISQLEVKAYKNTSGGANALLSKIEVLVQTTRDVSSGDSNLQLRFQLQNNSGALYTTDDYQLQYELNDSGTYIDVGTVVANYYFDSSDGAPTDPNSVWTNDGNAFDTSEATSASCSTVGSTSSNYLLGQGTNAPASGAAISQVRARLWNNSDDAQIAGAVVYSDGLAEALSTEISGDGVGTTYGSWVTLSAPSGGWTWAKVQALEAKIYKKSGGGALGIVAMQVEVTSGSAEVLGYNSASLTDGGATTNRLGSGSGSFVAGEISEDGLVDDLQITASNYTELLYSLTIDSDAVADNDTLDFRVLRNGATTGLTYTVTPRITVSKSANYSGTPGAASMTTATYAPTASLGYVLTPGAASLTISTFAPTVSIGTVLTPAAASMTTSTFAPTVAATDNKTATPSVASMTMSTFAPTVVASDNKTATPGIATLTLTGYAPTVSVANNQYATPDPASMTISTFAPTVSVTDNKAATPDVASMTTATFAPTVTATNHIAVTPGAASLALSSFAPTVTVSDNKSATPSPASLTLTSFAPTVSLSDNKSATPGIATMTTSTWAPTVAATSNVWLTPTAASLTITTYAPTVTATSSYVLTPAPASLTLTAQTPSVTAGDNKSAVPGTASLTITTYAPTVSLSDNKQVTPDLATLTISTHAPTVTLNHAITPEVASLVLAMFAPTVVASDHIAVSPSPTSMVLTGYAPSASVDFFNPYARIIVLPGYRRSPALSGSKPALPPTLAGTKPQTAVRGSRTANPALDLNSNRTRTP